MTVHVDIIKNDWGRDHQVLGARVYPTEHGIKIDPQNGDDWGPLVNREFTDPETRETLSPSSGPYQFLERLHKLIDSTYWYATTLHDEDLCPFREGHSVKPLVTIETQEGIQL